MSTQIHPRNLKYSPDLYACKLPKKRYLKAPKPLCTTTKLEFSRDKNAAIFIFRTPRRCALESFGTLLQKQHGERSSENETMTIYPDSLEQR